MYGPRYETSTHTYGFFSLKKKNNTKQKQQQQQQQQQKQQQQKTKQNKAKQKPDLTFFVSLFVFPLNFCEITSSFNDFLTKMGPMSKDFL